jgi:hypothetical protein
MTQSVSCVRLPHHRSRNRRYKTIAPAWNVRYVTSAAAAIKQRSAKVRHMNAKVRIFHQQVRPDLVDQVPPRNCFPRALDQCNQYIKRATSKRHRLIVSVQDAPGGGEMKRPKGQQLLCPRNRIVRH